MAVLLAAGEGGVLSHESAARRHRLDCPAQPLIQVTVPERRVVSSIEGAKLWRSRDLCAPDVTTQGPIQLTRLARTVLDLAAVLDERWLRACVDSALRQRPSNLAWLRRIVRRDGSGHRGTSRLGQLLAAYEGEREIPDSALESLALGLGDIAGQPPELHWTVFERDQFLGELDLAWPRARVGIELDGWLRHGSRQAFAADRARDRRLVANGWRVLRFTWSDVLNHPSRVREEILQTLGGAFEALHIPDPLRSSSPLISAHRRGRMR